MSKHYFRPVAEFVILIKDTILSSIVGDDFIGDDEIPNV
jgi:hypothetical protein